MQTLGALDWFLIGGFAGVIAGVGVTVALAAKSFMLAMKKMEENDNAANETR